MAATRVSLTQDTSRPFRSGFRLRVERYTETKLRVRRKLVISVSELSNGDIALATQIRGSPVRVWVISHQDYQRVLALKPSRTDADLAAEQRDILQAVDRIC